MIWVVLVDSSVKKKKKRLPKRDAERLTLVIKQLAINPYAGDIEKMDGEKDTWRRRIGSYRIKYEVHTSQKVVYVFDLQRRTSTTY